MNLLESHNDMRMSHIINRVACAVGIFFIISFCIYCGSLWKIDDRMEGFGKGFFRVYVRVGYLGKDGEEKRRDIIEREVVERARVRCAQYLTNHIRITLGNNEERASAILKMLPEVLDESQIRFLECFNDYCEAFVDFKSKGLEKELKKVEQGNNKKK
jgi:hypothetical protein